MALIQWNANGLKHKFDEIKILCQEFNPIAIAIQETRLKHNESVTLQNFKTYVKNSCHIRASRGVALFIKIGLKQEAVTLNSPLQVVACTIYAPRKITLVSIYLPGEEQLSKVDLRHLFQQLPQPSIIMGDFNSRSPFWGSQTRDNRGKIWEDLIDEFNLTIMNDGTATHFSSAYQSFSAIDLTLASPSLAPLLSWKTLEDLHHSDHFPIICNLVNLPRQQQGIRKKWNQEHADWNNFSNEIQLSDAFSHAPIDELVEHITKEIVIAADRTIPSTTIKLTKSVPWWNKSVEQAIKARKKALSIFKLSPTIENLINFKKLRAIARRTVKTSKQSSWESFLGQINPYTTSKDMWKCVRRINGVNKFFEISHMEENGIISDHLGDIANILGRSFAKNSDSSNYSVSFQRKIVSFASVTYNLNSNNSEHYNQPFTLLELECAVKGHKGTAPGPDTITYEMIKNLNCIHKIYILNTYNRIFSENYFPVKWRKAIVLPILKNRQAYTDPSNYRPISLTNCLSKTLERMVSRRLMWVLENRNLLSNMQTAFRHKRSGNDLTTHLETEVQLAFVRKEHFIAIFFDLEKAYERVYKKTIIEKLFKWNITGNITKFVSEFLKDRRFEVNINNTSSGEFTQENGVPQGSVLSVTMFLIAINSLAEFLDNKCKYLLFADDLVIFASGKNVNSLKQSIQSVVQSIEIWTADNGFKINEQKTKLVHFHRKNNLQDDINIRLNNKIIKQVPSVKFLGVFFDQKLNFKKHINELISKTTKSVNLIRTLSHTTWGGNRENLLKIHQAITLAQIDYGSAIYGSASKATLRKLDVIHNTGVRLAIGAFRTSPIVSILAEAGMKSLEQRRQIVTANQYIDLKSRPHLPLFKYTENSQRFFNFRNKTRQPFIVRAKNIAQTIQIQENHIFPIQFHKDPPWHSLREIINTSISKFKKHSTTSKKYTNIFYDIVNKFPSHTKVYTDGSRSDGKTGYAVVFPDKTICDRSNDDISSYSAEILAIRRAIENIPSEKDAEFLIMSDCLSCLSQLTQLYNQNNLLTDIRNKINANKSSIKFLWVPGHMQIPGNENADRSAKAACLKPYIDNNIITSNDCKNKIRLYIDTCRKDEWTNIVNNKLRKIKDDPFKRNTTTGKSRREESVLCRLRIGHTRLTHRHLIEKTEIPICNFCNLEQLTIEHIIQHCQHLTFHRTNFNITNIKDALGNNNFYVNNTIEFLKHIEIYDKI